MSLNINPKYASDLIFEIAERTQAHMLVQLGDLVTEGVLVWEKGEQILTIDTEDSNRVSLSFTGRLVLKDQEYVNRLKEENIALHRKLQAIRRNFNEVRQRLEEPFQESQP